MSAVKRQKTATSASFEDKLVDLIWQKRANPRLFRSKSLDYIFPLSRYEPPQMLQEDQIQERKDITHKEVGKSQLWSGYNEKYAKRSPKEVSTTILRGRFYSMLIQKLKPEVVVEIGSAFGSSGMYWADGLEANQQGHLYTFEVNKKWAGIAAGNISTISKRFTMTRGTFEDNVEKVIGDKKIDLGFIDGVHTSEWVIPQYKEIVARCRKGAVIILDDIAFSDDMESCWEKVISDERVKNAFRLNDRVGIIQLR